MLRAVIRRQTGLLESLEKIELENERWQSPNGRLSEIYTLQDQLEVVRKEKNECHQQWDQLGEEIEKKHL